MVYLSMRRAWLRVPTIGRLAAGRRRLAWLIVLHALSKLNANWRGVVEGAAYGREVEARSSGQEELTLESNNR